MSEKINIPGEEVWLCQCGGKLTAEQDEHGNLADAHDVYRIRCSWCPMSTRWMTSLTDCLDELFGGMEKRRQRKGY